MQHSATEKKRILHLLSSNTFSGAENVACQIIKLFEKDARYEMFYCSPDGPIRKTLAARKVHFIKIRRMSYRQLRQIIKENDIDTIHAHDIKASVLAGLFKRYYRKKSLTIISHIHGNHIGMRKVGARSLLFRMAARDFKHIFWVSESCYEGYIFKRQARAKSSVLRNVIDAEDIMQRAKMAEKQNRFDIIFIGRLVDAKDPLRILEVMKSIVQADNAIKCGIIGSGEYSSILRKMIDTKNLKQNIHLSGFMDNPYGILRNARVLLMTSKHEGLPMVVLESLSLGVPVISTPTDGICDLYSGTPAEHYLGTSNEVLAEIILGLLNNPERYAEARETMSRIFLKHNDSKQYQEDLADAYQ